VITHTKKSKERLKMKTLNTKRKSFAKTVIAAAVMIGSTTALFQGLTQVAAANEIGKKDIIPTSYAAVSYPAAGSLQSAQESAPKGYVKPTYTVVDNSLEAYRDRKPTANDISREEAAEVGVQALWSVFGLDLNGKTIEMGYNPAEDMVRAKWTGEYWIDGQSGPDHPVYGFTIDAVTGELHGIRDSRTLKENVSVGFDGALAQNPQEYEALAKRVAEQYNAVHGAVKSAEYASQGVTGNDPTISIRVSGENGEQAQISFSRYDKALLSIAFDSWCKEADAIAQKIEEEMKTWEEIPYEGTENTLVPVLVPRP